MNAIQMIEKAKQARTAAGLKLTFIIPDQPEPFTCYPKDEAQKQKWLQNAKAKNWELI
jgi:hypothetical protein